jgi:acyl-CoA reductase-like NAD-dependent aldehyde dehydrogenase
MTDADLARATGTVGAVFTATDPATGAPRPTQFVDATDAEIDASATAAAEAFEQFRATPAALRADLLKLVAVNLCALGDELLDVARGETGLDHTRLRSERARTCDQLRRFAALLRKGHHLDAIIDTAAPDAAPPRADLRRMQVPVGPVAVFGASNFPLAFSVPGGDTASALAAGCPVVVKAHPSHPETSELCGRAIDAAVAELGLPPGTFSLVHGHGRRVGARLVQHPAVAAVGFTGSETAGRALVDLAARRRVPIPVYAEMGSINPLLITAEALRRRGRAIAEGLVDSVLLGGGQFCTKPGLVLHPGGTDGEELVARVVELATGDRRPVHLLSAGIRDGLHAALASTETIVGAAAVHRGTQAEQGITAAPVVVVTDTRTVLEHEELLREHFGPVTLLVRYDDLDDLLGMLRVLPGSLTLTVHAEPDTDDRVSRLLPLLEQKAGRLVWNSFPTGVAVTGAMHHGGPYPASSSPAHTSVGWTAIRRFLRPVSLQNWPDDLLPPELQDRNPLGVPRLVNGGLTTGPVASV